MRSTLLCCSLDVPAKLCLSVCLIKMRPNGGRLIRCGIVPPTRKGNIQIAFSGKRYVLVSFSSGTGAVMSPQDIQLITAVSPYYVWQFRLHLIPITKKIIWGNNDPLIFFSPLPALQSILPASKSVLELHHSVCKVVLQISKCFFLNRLTKKNNNFILQT